MSLASQILARRMCLPRVLVRSPYGRRQVVGMLLGRLLAKRGLAVVIQSVRGTFGSGGRFSPFDERGDGPATLRWIRAQPWHAGPVGTFEPSYSIQVSASQFYDETYTGGSLSQESRLAPLAINRALRGLAKLWAELPLGDLDERRTGGGWRELPAWPPPGTGEPRLYLDDGGALSDQPANTSGADGYRYDPADPTPSLGGPLLLERSAVVDNAPLEAREDVLTYTTGPLAQTLEAIGHVSVELWARADGPSFDLFARVCDVDVDVDAEGVSRNVSDALVSVASGRTQQDADGAGHVSFELWPIGHRFAARHRIRLQISSGAHPRYARNPRTGDGAVQASAETMRAVEVQILRGAEHPSALVLPTGA